MILSDAVTVERNADAVFRFFDEMDRHYLHWHPDHKTFRWIEGNGARVGSIAYFEEVIAGKLLRKRVVFTRVDRPEYIEFAPTFWLMRAFLPRMVFRIEKMQDATSVVAEIHLRMGPLAAWLNRKELAAVRQHMHEEGQNLKRLVESASAN